MPKNAEDTLEVGTPAFHAFERFLSLTLRKRALNDELRDVNAALDAMEPQLLAHIAGLGFAPPLYLGGYKFFPRREAWVSLKEGYTKDDLFGVLAANDMGQFITHALNTRGLGNHIVALEEQSGVTAVAAADLESLLPEELLSMIELKPSFRLIVQRR